MILLLFQRDRKCAACRSDSHRLSEKKIMAEKKPELLQSRRRHRMSRGTSRTLLITALSSSFYVFTKDAFVLMIINHYNDNKSVVHTYIGMLYVAFLYSGAQDSLSAL